MTQKFLDTFFMGDWSNYGHFTLVIIVACILLDFLHPTGAAFGAFVIVSLLEFHPKNNFSWLDIMYNAFGAITFALYHLILLI